MAAKKKSRNSTDADRRKSPEGGRVPESRPRDSQTTVVGMCASAGGLEAFKKFFAHMPLDSGIVFVLVPHLDPHHESMMVELMARCTPLPVLEATDGMAVKADHVYVLPPNAYMTLSEGRLRLTGPVQRGGLQTSIDLFLRSLAADKQEHAVGVVLSGTGSHGSLGLKAIKAHGGMSMVQDPSTAQFSRMPEAAIALDLADYILPVEKMPAVLVAYVNSCRSERPDTAEGEGPDDFDRLLSLIRAQSKFDFRPYRKKMLHRRIHRRMSLRQFQQFSDYVAYLGNHPEEVKTLFRDLLISVTHFFRDAEAFQSLETEALNQLVEAKGPDEPLRVWSAGCATGEESYSLAILLMERVEDARKNCPIQIFATDVDEHALDVARAGLYPESIRADVSADRLGRFFTHADDSYRVTKQLRETVNFARQNLIADAPFSKLDLIVCRNVLIYLEPDVQKKVIGLFHFSLNKGGFLFLGSSETIGRETGLFEAVSKKWRVFRRKGPARVERVSLPTGSPVVDFAPARLSGRPISAPIPGFAELTQKLLLEQFAPASVLVNGKFEVLFAVGPTDRYLSLPAGKPSLDLTLLVREGLRARLRSAIRKAMRENAPVTIAHAHVKVGGEDQPLKVTVRPVREPHGDDLLLVTFEDPTTPGAPSPDVGADEPLVRQLEYDLKMTQEDLQTTIEEMESSNEELKVSHEEVMSMNEELQSANEELETSKEEMQSLNEELTTVNSQLQEKVEELETANSDIANLLNCSDVAIVFLDSQLRIKQFTPLVTRLFNLIPTDVGRAIGDITPKFPDGTLQQDVERALRTLVLQEEQLQTPDGAWWSRRITPYRTSENRIEGVAITFIDVTHLKEADAQAQRFAAVVMDSNDAIIVHDLDGTITAWNHGAEHVFGYTEAEALGMNVQKLLPDEASAKDWRRQLRLAQENDGHEALRRTKDGRILDVWITATTLHDPAGTAIAIAKTERDITSRKELERDVVEIASLEQRRIGQDLHDTVGQELTALNLVAGDLADVARTDPDSAPKLIEQIVQGLQRTRRDLRTVLRGLFPVAIESDGLRTSLAELAERVQQDGKVACTFDCPEPVKLSDNVAATHLYFIAQEAVHNAIKHSQARKIRICLDAADLLVLQVQDDGIGMPATEQTSGLGLRIMKNRAAIIGADLTIRPADPRGTVVACAITRDDR